MIADPVAALPQVRAGNIKAYAVSADKRLPSAPDIPTVDEAGLPGYHVSCGMGLWLPKGTPKPIIASLTPRSWRRSPTRRCGRSSARSGRRSTRASSRRRRRSPPSEGRDRKMVADHQGRQHQGGLNHPDCTASRPRTALTGCRQRAQPWRGVRNLSLTGQSDTRIRPYRRTR